MPLVGICTGTFILARLGLAKGKRVCLANYHYREFAQRFPDAAIVHDQLWHQDGDLITCASGTAAIDLAGQLLSSRFGEDRRLKIGKLTMATGLRAPSAPQWLSASRASPIQDIRISRALSLMEQYTASPISISEIAGKVGVTGKQLERLFKLTFNETPARFDKRLPLQCGHWMLQNSGATIAQIAFDCSFFDHSHFTKAFEGRYGFPPSLLRRDGILAKSKVTSIPSRPPA